MPRAEVYPRFHERTRGQCLFRLRRSCALLVFALVPLTGAHAAVMLLTVGDDPGCGYRTSTSSNALQNAVDAVPLSVPPGDLYVIRVARSGSYVGTTLSISDRTLLMEGGYPSCSSVAPDGNNTVIDGNGANRAVVEIENTLERKTLTLANLTLTGARGNVSTGLRITGADVDLRRVRLEDNTGAIRGGGARIEGTGLGARLTLDGGSAVSGNVVTQEGGGIYCARGAVLELQSNSIVSGNQGGSGGGVYINGCSGYINSGASGLSGLFVNIGSNSASFGGGGVYLDSTLGPTDFAIGAGLGVDDPRPVIALNSAGAQGGGIMAIGAGTRLTVRNALIVSNESGSLGGAIQARNGAQIVVEQTLPRCGSGTQCSTLVDNTANFGGALSVSGADTRLIVRRTRITGNTANLDGSALFNQSQGAYALLENVLIDGNTGASVIEASRSSSTPPLDTTTEIVASTIAGNSGLNRVLSLNDDGAASIALTIIHAAGSVPAVQFGAGNEPATECSVFHESASLTAPGPRMAFSNTPGFTNPASQDWRLSPFAFALDRCPMEAGYPDVDIEFKPRPFDMPFPNIGGPTDVGAYETNLTLFKDGFESLR